MDFIEPHSDFGPLPTNEKEEIQTLQNRIEASKQRREQILAAHEENCRTAHEEIAKYTMRKEKAEERYRVAHEKRLRMEAEIADMKAHPEKKREYRMRWQRDAREGAVAAEAGAVVAGTVTAETVAAEGQ